MDELRKQVERWIEKARHDLVTPQTMLSAEQPLTDVTAYHAQQCMEKVLKAFLCSKGVDIPRTHDLPRLLSLCSEQDSSFIDLGDEAKGLTDYAVVTRYPDDWYEISFDEASEAIKAAQKSFRFVRDKLD